VALRRRNFLLAFGLTSALPLGGIGAVLAARPSASAVAAGLGLAYLLLLAIAALSASGLHRHATESERLAHHDALTGVANRRLFDRRLAALLDAGGAAAVVLVDVDRFKDVNDLLGHLSGDEVLRQTAERLTSSVRGSDTVARLGGDEFGILIPGAGPAEGRQVARRIAEALPVAASLGVACAPAHGTRRDTLIGAADRAMYRAKADGGGYRVAESTSREPKGPGQAIGALRPVRRAAPAKGG
jgi:diguanylate cyclase (GGDEF)-like protein